RNDQERDHQRQSATKPQPSARHVCTPSERAARFLHCRHVNDRNPRPGPRDNIVCGRPRNARPHFLLVASDGLLPVVRMRVRWIESTACRGSLHREGGRKRRVEGSVHVRRWSGMWTKPSFEELCLCAEVTAYVYSK